MKIRLYLLLFLILSFFSCKIGEWISIVKVNNNLRLVYGISYNNRTSKHKPVRIYVSVDTMNTKFKNHSLYTFFVNSRNVEKYSNYGGDIKKSYLVFDSTSTSTQENLSSINSLEYTIFEKVIYFSDSMHLNDFRYLRKATGFKLH